MRGRRLGPAVSGAFHDCHNPHDDRFFRVQELLELMALGPATGLSALNVFP